MACPANREKITLDVKRDGKIVDVDLKSVNTEMTIVVMGVNQINYSNRSLNKDKIGY